MILFLKEILILTFIFKNNIAYFMHEINSRKKVHYDVEVDTKFSNSNFGKIIFEKGLY